MKNETRFKSIHTLPKSVDKLFTYLGNITKEKFTVELDKFKKEYEPPKKVVVSNNLFRQYSCLDYNCSRCCWKNRYWNIFTPNQFKELKKEYSKEKYDGNLQQINVNRKKCIFYVENHTETDCPHLNRNKNFCKINTHNPIHCALPLIKFKNVKGITYITREYFGRNWLMKCPAKFKEMDEGGFQTTLWMLNRVRDFAKEMNINTYIDEIIDDVKNKWEVKKKDGKQANLFAGGDASIRPIQ